MKLTIIKRVLPVMILLPLRGFAAGQDNPKDLAAAKISRSQAEAIALRASHGGKIKDGEIEREKGHLVWSFDIAKPKTSAITEVLVEARTGQVISIQEEDSAQQAAEAKADAQPRR